MYLLGYDIGSSSVKASLVNAETGKCVSSAFFPKTEAAIMAYLYDFLTLILSLSTLLLPMFSGKVRFLPYICSKNV